MQRSYVIATLVLILVIAASTAEAEMNSKNIMTSSKTFIDIPFQTITGDTTSLRQFQGKAFLIVNVASKCGFTPQYKGLQELYLEFKDKGLEIIGFPANDFMGQEPGTDEEIAQFCEVNYGVTFPMMSKISVKGKSIHPLYKYLTEESNIPGEIKWNFSKFILDSEYNLVSRFDPKVDPLAEELVSDIEKLLSK